MKNNRNNFKTCRLGLQCLANVFTLIAVCLIIAAMFTSGWKVTYLDINFTSVYEQGLYRDCIRGELIGIIAIFSDYRSVNDDMCLWKFDQYNNQIRSDSRLLKVRDFQRTVFVLLGVSCLLAFATLIVACTTCFQRYCNVLWAMLSLLTTVAPVAGVVVFVQSAGVGYGKDFGANVIFRGATGAGRTPYGDYDNQLYGYSGNAWYGLSFYICIAGIVAQALVCVLACVCTCLSFMEAKREQQEQIITPSSGDSCLYSISRNHSMTSLRKAVRNSGLHL